MSRRRDHAPSICEALHAPKDERRGNVWVVEM